MRQFVAIVLSSALVLQVGLLAAPAKGGTNTGAQAPVTPGNIKGIAQSSTGQVLATYSVQVRSLHTGQLAGRTTTDSAGSFAFAGLPPGSAVVELVSPAGAIVGSSALIVVGANATTNVTVFLAAAALSGAPALGSSGGHVNKAVLITSIAAAAAITGVIIIRKDASPSN